ncbi:hypothetical protein [Streptomyces sp. NPDC048669]|uniref:hypothetical protein n=1 Tax=Streptomyces sp. NPDC048669 TaxID=3155267 RepID=UPI00343FA671
MRAAPAVSVAVDGDGLVAVDVEAAVFGVEFFPQGSYVALQVFDLGGLNALSPLSFLRPAGLHALPVCLHESLLMVGGVEFAGESRTGKLRAAGSAGLSGAPAGPVVYLVEQGDSSQSGGRRQVSGSDLLQGGRQ